MSDLRETVLQMLWSLWTEMGIPGSVRNHRHLLADPEPLIVYTPHLAAEDSRLLGLVFDWCAAHSNWVSKSRIKSIAGMSTEEVQQALGRFNGSLSACCGVHWSPGGEPGGFAITRRTMALPVDRPSMLGVRTRALAGVSARAEVLTRLIAAGGHPLAINDLADSGTSRRSVERVVGDLTRAGFVAVYGKARGRRFSLREHAAFSACLTSGRVDGMCSNINWHIVMSTLVQLTALLQHGSLSVGLRRVEAVNLSLTLAQNMRALQQGEPPHLSGREDAFDQLMSWGHSVATEWAAGRMTV